MRIQIIEIENEIKILGTAPRGTLVNQVYTTRQTSKLKKDSMNCDQESIITTESVAT